MVKLNGQKKKQTPKAPVRKKGKGASKAGKRNSTLVPSHLAPHPYAYARLDPFDPRAVGAKVPDFDNNASIANQFVFDLSVTTNSSGNTCVVVPFWPSHLTEIAAWNGTASRFELTGTSYGTLTQSASFFTGWDECVGARVVGAGLKIRSQMNQMSASGQMYICPMSTAEMRAWKAQGNTGGYNFTDIKNRKTTIKKMMAEMATGQELKCTSTVLDPTALSYLAPEIDIFNMSFDLGDFPNYLGFVIMVEGPPNNNMFDLQLVLHLEWLPGKTFNFLTTPPEQANTSLLERVNNAAEMAPSIITTLGDIAGNVFQAVKTGLSVAGTLGLIAL